MNIQLKPKSHLFKKHVTTLCNTVKIRGNTSLLLYNNPSIQFSMFFITITIGILFVKM